MIVKTILEHKASPHIEVIAPDAHVEEAAKKLDERKIGALIVQDKKKRLVGIISERDIVAAVARRGTQCLEIEVQDIMTRNITTISPVETAHKALEIMTLGRFRHLPVLENDHLVGIISIGDVVSVRLREIEEDNTALSSMITGQVF